MEKTYYISIVQGKKYLEDLEVTISINDVENFDYDINNIIYEGFNKKNEWFDVTDKLKRFESEIYSAIDNCIMEDESLIAEFNDYLDDMNDDLEFRAFYEG